LYLISLIYVDAHFLSDEVKIGICLLKVKDECNLSNYAYNEIMQAFGYGGFSLYRATKTLTSLVPFDASYVDICINSCCAFTGIFKSHTSCSYCHEERYQSNAKNQKTPRKQAPYFSLIDRFRIQYACQGRSREMRYRNEYISTNEYVSEEEIGDIFDGELYKSMVKRGFFQDERDIALLASVDGYQLFRQKTEENWIVLFMNGNIPPAQRVKKENMLIVAMFPGPQAPKDFNSFMRPIIDELKSLEGNNLILLIMLKIYQILTRYSLYCSWNSML